MMRWLFVIAVLCLGMASPANRPYTIFIFAGADGEDMYAFKGPAGATAVEVRDGEARLVDDAAAAVSELEARRRGDATLGVVTTIGPGSRIRLGPDGKDGKDEDDGEDEDKEHEPHDSLVVMEDASARQVRDLIAQIDAASPQMKRELERVIPE